MVVAVAAEVAVATPRVAEAVVTRGVAVAMLRVVVVAAAAEVDHRRPHVIRRRIR